MMLMAPITLISIRPLTSCHNQPLARAVSVVAAFCCAMYFLTSSLSRSMPCLAWNGSLIWTGIVTFSWKAESIRLSAPVNSAIWAAVTLSAPSVRRALICLARAGWS